MKGKTSLLVLILLLGILLFPAVLNLVQDQSMSGAPIFNSAQAADRTSAMDYSIPVLKPADQTLEETDSQALTESTLTLIDKWRGSLIAKGGWLHYRVRIDQEGVDPGSLPDGTRIPQVYIFDSWYLLDQNGLVIEGVSRMIDLNTGDAIQTSVFKDHAWINLTTGVRQPGDDFSPVLDNNVSKSVASLGSSVGITSFDVRDLADQREVEVITYEDFVAPVSFAGVSSEASSIITRSRFDSETGMPISYETILRTESGEEILIRTVEVLAVETVTSPADDIQAILEEGSR